MLFQTLRNAAKVSASLIACGGRAFHSLGAEVEKTETRLVYFSAALGIIIIIHSFYIAVFSALEQIHRCGAMMSEGVVQEPIVQEPIVQEPIGK